MSKQVQALITITDEEATLLLYRWGLRSLDLPSHLIEPWREIDKGLQQRKKIETELVEQGLLNPEFGLLTKKGEQAVLDYYKARRHTVIFADIDGDCFQAVQGEVIDLELTSDLKRYIDLLRPGKSRIPADPQDLIFLRTGWGNHIEVTVEVERDGETYKFPLLLTKVFLLDELELTAEELETLERVSRGEATGVADRHGLTASQRLFAFYGEDRWNLTKKGLCALAAHAAAQKAESE